MHHFLFMLRVRICLFLCVVVFAAALPPPRSPLYAQALPTHTVLPGDTWDALAWRYDLDAAALQAHSPHPNTLRQPVIGSTITLPGQPAVDRRGIVQRTSGSSLDLALATGQNVYHLARANGLVDPLLPTFYRAIGAETGNQPPRDWPVGVSSLELSHLLAQPGWGLGIRGTTNLVEPLRVSLDAAAFNLLIKNNHFVGVIGTGAFYRPGDWPLELSIVGEPLWSQPWRMGPGTWEYQDLTLTGAAAAITAEQIAAERERLFVLWNQATPVIYWDQPFQLPISDFLHISALYGVRRSYNGGDYNSYHEGVDFSAYGGTPVFAAAAGQVVVAELLNVRGGTVIIDHGLGIYTGVYHLSDIQTQVGQLVQPGDAVGAVGTTGLSTGNHLHWDLLVAGTWVNALAWYEQNMGCWLLAGLNEPCTPS